MNIVIFGATSAIAQAWARLRAAQRDSFYLLGRDNVKLEVVKQDLLARGAQQVHCHVIDLAHPQDYNALIAQI